MRIRFLGLTAALLGYATTGSAAAPSNGETAFQRTCAACHMTAGLKGVPTLDAMREFTPEALLTVMTTGKMSLQASLLSESERREVAEFASGRRFSETVAQTKPNTCSVRRPMDDMKGAAWNGWGNGVTNARYQPAEIGGLTAADLPKLKLKWAFGYANVSAVRPQPAVVGGRLFVASENANVHALDPKSGCEYWTYKAQAGIRTAISVGPYKMANRSGTAVYFGDSRAHAYAVDADTGEQLWVRKVDEHPAAAITGSPVVYDGRLFVPVQGVQEESMAGNSKYPCCTFRGSLSALDASTGEVLWKTYTSAEPKPRTKNNEGVQMYGPAGVSIWSAPTVDAKRGLVYVATGNSFSEISQPTSNAVIAMDVRTGAMKWVKQVTPNDNWVFGCIQPGADPAACPKELGPDHDFAAPPALTSVNGRDLIVLPQKSGTAWAMDPDRKGEIVWQQRIGQGSAMGGQWGGGLDGRNAYFGIADLQTPTPGGMRALDLATGKLVWSVGPQPALCAPGPGCMTGQGSAVTIIPGAVLSAGVDGGLRAYSIKDGSIFWTFNTGRDFDTVNGVKAKGGGIDGAGPVVIGKMLFIASGYGGFVGRPGNVLLAFGLDE